MPIIRPAWGGVNLNSLVKYSIRKGSTIVPARLINEAAARIQDSLGRPPRSRQGFQEEPRIRFQVFISKSPRSNRAADFAPVAGLETRLQCGAGAYRFAADAFSSTVPGSPRSSRCADSNRFCTSPQFHTFQSAAKYLALSVWYCR